MRPANIWITQAQLGTQVAHVIPPSWPCWEAETVLLEPNGKEIWLWSLGVDLSIHHFTASFCALKYSKKSFRIHHLHGKIASRSLEKT